MKRLLILLIITCQWPMFNGQWSILNVLHAQSEVPAPHNIFARDITSLNGDWHYFADPQEQGYYDYRMNKTRWGYFLDAKPQRPSDLIEYSFDKSPTMRVPSDWSTQDPMLYLYEGTVWYRRTFDLPPTPSQGGGDDRVLLYFGAVNYEAIVFLNGKELGRHVGGFTPFCYDVTDVLRKGQNTLVVKVDNKRHADNVPTRVFDWWNYGGITRDVLLVRVRDTYIEDYTLQMASKQLQGVAFSVSLNRGVEGREITLSIPELKVRKTLKTDAEGHASLTLPKLKPQLWSPDNPKLYKVTISLDDQTISDEVGFRVIETRGRELLLNGKPIFLKGICMHDESAYTSHRITTKAEADTLLSWAKAIGCNFIRLAHYPHNELTVREAERQGILLWEEIPVYWTISWDNPQTLDNARRQLTDLIRRDHNRCATIIWSIANETPHSDARDRFLSTLASHARSLDNTRLISMAMEVTSASNYVNRLHDNMHQYVDVVSFNQYVGWYRDVADAPKMTWEVPYEKPVIVSEFGGGALAGMHGAEDQRWTEEFQARVYRENLEMLSKIQGLAGTCPWVLKDFRSPRRLLPGIQDHFNRKGVVSDQGKRKQAFQVLHDWYNKK